MKRIGLAVVMLLLAAAFLLGCMQPPAPGPEPGPAEPSPEDEILNSIPEAPAGLQGMEEMEVALEELEDLAEGLKDEGIADSGIAKGDFE